MYKVQLDYYYCHYIVATSPQQSLFFVTAGSPYFDSCSNLSVTATSLQEQLILPPKRVPNCKKTINNGQFLQSTDEKVKNGHEIWSIWRVSLWWLISTIYYFDRIPFMP